jgi:ribosomal protein L11 methylase PrmA
MTKNTNYTGDWYSDLITANPTDKDRDVPWEQPQDVFDALASRFIQKAGIILLDPCCGSGTSLIAGIKTGLCARVIGVDIDPVAVKTARKRVDGLMYGEDNGD